MTRNKVPANSNGEWKEHKKLTAIVTIVFVLWIFFPLGILGAALEWPSNLSEDASHNLPLLLKEDQAAFWGYFLYLLYSILFFPMGYLFAKTVAGPDLAGSPLLPIASGLAALSAVSRSIGLSRWLFAMPTLARMYVDPNVSETTKETISVVYEMLNGWGGGIGELLGVSLFAALWVVCVSLLFVQSPQWPSWMGYIGFLVAIDLSLNLMEMSILDYDMGINLTLAVVFLHLWLVGGSLFFLDLSCCRSCLPHKDLSSSVSPNDHNVDDNDEEKQGEDASTSSNRM